jgi:hypothetical protein
MTTRRSARSPSPDPDDRYEELQSTIQMMQAQIDELTVARVTLAPAPVPIPASAPPAANTHAPKVRDPEFFNGGPDSNLPRFLAQVQLVFRDNPTHFLSDEKKVNYAISHFRGAASSWVEPFFGMTELPAWMSNFALFEAELKKVFHHADQLLKVVHDLLRLKQTDSVRSYAIEFHRLASRLQWPNQPLAGIFYYGLKTSIRVELLKHQDILDRKLKGSALNHKGQNFHETDNREQHTPNITSEAPLAYGRISFSPLSNSDFYSFSFPLSLSPFCSPIAPMASRMVLCRTPSNISGSYGRVPSLHIPYGGRRSLTGLCTEPRRSHKRKHRINSSIHLFPHFKSQEILCRPVTTPGRLQKDSAGLRAVAPSVPPTVHKAPHSKGSTLSLCQEWDANTWLASIPAATM